MKKLLFLLFFFFWINSAFAFSWDTSQTFTGELIVSDVQTFIDLDLQKFDYQLTLTWVTTSSWVIEYFPDYSKQFSDTNKLLFQIEVLLLIIWFFILLFVFTSIINDLIWKK